MVEANEDPTAVMLTRAREHAQAQEQPRTSPRDGTDLGAIADALAADIPFPGDTPGVQSASTPTDAPATALTLQAPATASDAPLDDAAFRHTRLAITAGLVVLLLVLWIWQRGNAR